MRVVEYTLVWGLLLLVCSNAKALDMEEITRDTWLELKSSNFHVISDAQPEVSKKLVRDLEEFRYFISVILRQDILEGVPPVRILAIYDTDNFEALGLPELWGGVFTQTDAGSFAIANIDRYETDSDDSSHGKSTLMHEYVHYAMGNTFTRRFYPRWYAEGMAEYLSTFRHDGEKITLGRLDVLGNRFYHLRSHGFYHSIELEELFKTKGINAYPENDKERRALLKFYARATAAVHYFRSTKSNQVALASYIELINSGYDVDTAFSTVFGRTFKEVDNQILKYLKSRWKSANIYSAGDNGLQFPDIDINVRELDEKSIYHQFSDILANTWAVSDDQKRGLIGRAIRKNPENLDLKALLADHYLEEDPEVSRAIVETILEQEPLHAAARAIKGDLIAEQAALGRRAGLEGWQDRLDQALREYRLAVKADRFYPRPYSGIGAVYRFKPGTRLLKEGAASLDSARFFASQRALPGLYFKEAMLRIRMGDYENAIKTMRGYINLSDTGYANGFGRFLYESWAYRMLPAAQHDGEKNQYVYKDGSVYTGGWQRGRPHGKGRLRRANGAEFKGKWSRGLLTGQGEFISSNGFHYTGQFSKGGITGTGKLTYPEDNPVQYTEGDFFNGLEHGRQELVYRSGDRSIRRYWMGYAHGRERYYKKDQDSEPVIYQRVYGAYKVPAADDTIYVGQLDDNDRPDGRGVCYNRTDKQPYRCEYENGEEVPGEDA